MKFLNLEYLLRNIKSCLWLYIMIFFLINVYTLNIFSGNLVSKEQLNVETGPKVEFDATKRLFDSQLSYLKELNFYLQYLAQIVSKNKLHNCKSKDFLHWIKHHQRVILELETYNGISPTQENLNNLVLNIGLLAGNLVKNVKNKFSNLEYFGFNQNRRQNNSIEFADIDKLSSMSYINSKVIENLKLEIDNMGLTNLNKLVRKLDLLNDKYKITTMAEYAPLASLALASGVYFLPKSIFKNVPILRNVKDFLGTSIYTDPNGVDPKYKEQYYKHHVAEDGFASLFNVFDSKIFTGLGFVFTAYFSNSSLSPYTKFLRMVIANKWNRLKGFKVDDIARGGEVIEGLTLDDERIIGLDNQIEELYKLVNYIVEPEIYDKANTGLDKGILLAGPSGSGKTFIAKALCGTLNKAMRQKGFKSKFAFKVIKPSDVVWDTDGLKKIIAEAKQDAPCILFVDEIHNLPLQAKDFAGNVLTAFLTEMSGVNTETDARHQFIILGATDKPHLLDRALLRPGRFGNIIYLEEPNYENRKKYFEVNLKNRAVNIKNLDIDLLVRQTQGCSYSDLGYIIKNALFKACTNSDQLTQKALQEQICKHVYKLRDDISFTPFEKKHIAAHQAGHALMYSLLNPERKLELVTIAGSWRKIEESSQWDLLKQKTLNSLKSTKYSGLFTYLPAESLDIEDSDEKAKLAKISLAGALAERVLLGSPGYKCSSKLKQNIFHSKDKAKALNYLKSIVFDGLEPETVPKAIRENLEVKAYNMLLEAEAEVLEILNNNKVVLDKISQELEDKVTLTYADIRQIIGDLV